MHKLESVKLIQFFLYEKEEFRLGQTSAIIGPNASGKSAIMDAVQIALLGANSRYVALNAQADETTTTRSLRSYCLGILGEREEDRVRDSSTTYITLTWRNTQTNEPVSMGVCLHAEAGRDGHEVQGRFVARGVEFSMGDHLDVVNGVERPRAWSAFRHQLIERCKLVTGDDPPIYLDSERYIRAALLALRGDGPAASPDAFIRALRFGLRMRFNKSVDEIVRNEVLEPRPTNIRKFKEVTESFRQLAETVKGVEGKLNDGEEVEKFYAKAADESARAATWGVLARDAQHEACSDDLNTATKNKFAAEATLQDQEAEYEAGIENEKRARQKILEYRRLRESHSAHKDYGALQTEVRIAAEKKDAKIGDVVLGLGGMRHTLIALASSSYLAKEKAHYTAAAQTIEAFTKEIETQDHAQLKQALKPALYCLAKASTELIQHGHSLHHAVKDAETRVQSARDALDRVSEGRAPLSNEAQRLRTEFSNHGINSVPVCDLVRITDTAWQPVIEANLGRNVEALLVDAGREREAFEIYRGLTGRNAIYGIKVVAPSSVKLDFAPPPGSVAELIQGDNHIAVAYLRQSFRNALRAETAEQALGKPHAFTRDGMRVVNGEFSRLKPRAPGELHIGVVGRSHQQTANDELKRAQYEFNKLDQEQRGLTSLQQALMRFANEEQASSYLRSAWDEMAEAKIRLEALNLQISSAADEEYVRLGEQESHFEGVAKEIGKANAGLLESIGGAKEKLRLCAGKVIEATQSLDQAAQAADEARRNPEFDAAFATKQWDTLIAKYERRNSEIIAHCERVRNEYVRRANGSVNNASGALGTFAQKYQEQVPPQGEANDWRKMRAWLQVLLTRLRDTDLLAYKTQMQEAYETSRETFRNDVAIALNENIEWLEATMDRMNAVLRESPTFSNGERYRFHRNVRPQLATLLKFIRDVAAHGASNDLWGAAGGVPDQFRQLLDDKIAAGAAGMSSPLDDYREFFEFDIQVLRDDPVTRQPKIVANMSKRIGSGSGGEHRAPLYVIAGAALASAYRLDRGNAGGLRLMLIDEAFIKMDPTNIIATMRYLEQLGLQVFLATPGENLGTLTAFLDRYYDIYRDTEGSLLLLGAHDVSAETREMFREDLPEFHPEIIERELAAMREEVQTNRVAEATASQH